MESIRILHVVYALNRGGMESRIMDLYRHINKERYQFDFYIESGKSGVFDDEVKRLGGRVFYSNRNRKHSIPDFKGFRFFLSSHPEFKIIYAYNQWSGFYLKQAKKNGIPFRIANARTAVNTYSIKNIVKNIVKQNTNRYATHRFAVSKKAGVWLFGKDRADNGQVTVWPNAIDTRKYAFSLNVRKDVRNELGLLDELSIIHVGNLRAEKNHPYLLSIFEKVLELYPNAKLILVGDGNYQPLEEIIKKKGIEKSVRYLGVRSDINRILQAGDYFIFPSLYEGFPGAVLEAEASGLKCIISDTITEEVMLTNHIVALPLSADISEWVKSLEQFSDVKRENAWMVVKNAGYDINDLVMRTQGFYESLNVL